MESIRKRSAAWRRIAESMHDAVKAHCRATGDTEQTIADDCGLPLGTLSNYLCGHLPTPMDIAVRLTNLTGRDEIARAFGSLTNHLVIPMPEPGEHPEIDQVLQETADVLRAYRESVQDGKITEDECTHLVREIEEAQAALEAMKQKVLAAEVRKPQLRLRGM